MQINEVIEYLSDIKERYGDEIDVQFLCNNGEKSVRVSFNICTMYTENQIVIFSLEGQVTQIFKIPKEKNEQNTSKENDALWDLHIGGIMG